MASSYRRFGRAAVLVWFLAGRLGMPVAVAQVVRGGAGDGQGPATLAPVLGDVKGEWDLVRYQGAAEDRTVKEIDGRTALLAGANGLVISTHEPLGPDTEIDAVFRLASVAPDYRGSTAVFEAGMKSSGAYGQATQLTLNVPAGAANADTINWSVSGTPNHGGPYAVRPLPASRGDWPLAVRLHVEQDFANQPHLAQRWVTMRWVLRQDSMQVYLDGRLLEDRHGPTAKLGGVFELRAFTGAEIAGMAVHRLGPEDPAFVPVSIDDDLNTNRFAGQVLSPETPSDGKTRVIAGVPFAFPGTDQFGNNHIDLSPSWVFAACVPIASDSAYGDTARFPGAMSRNPGRIQFRVRNARYMNLHLIAAAEGGPDTVPLVTAQFFRTSAGHPVDFAARVPVFTAHAKSAVPLRLADGRKGNLFLVTIPLEPESLARFSDTDVVELELTKETQLYRSTPDPAYYSSHGAGLPSSVHVFAMTLERPGVDFDFDPDRYANIFTAPVQPAYALTMRNTTDRPQTVKAVVTSAGHDGEEKTDDKQSTTVPPHGVSTLHFALAVRKYGYHDVKLVLDDEQGRRTRSHGMVYLHPDTREHGDWQEGRGVIYGMWDWGGGHDTPTGVPRLQVAYDAGIESSMNSFNLLKEDEKEFVLKHKMYTRFLGNILGMSKAALGVDWDPSKPEAMAKAVVESVQKNAAHQATPYNLPSLTNYIGEPSLGNHLGIWIMSLPEYYNDPPYVMSPDEVASVNHYMSFLLIGGGAIKKQWPQAKINWAYGIANFPIAFMRTSKEAAALMDGPAIDMAPFEREPELQVGQVTLQNEMWQLKQEWAKWAAPKPWPQMYTIEGPCNSPAWPGALTPDEEGQNTVRTMLALMAYNVNQILGWPSLFQCANYWGESHYGGGLCGALPTLDAHVNYAEFATLTRRINRVNFTKYLDTGSHSAYCLQFKHYKTGDLVHVMWTLRGTRPVTLSVAPGEKIEVYDSMDNLVPLKTQKGTVTFAITAAPCYIHSLTGDAKVTLGEADHQDAQPAHDALRLANLGDGSWHVTKDRDDYYETAHFEFARKFPGPMSATAVDAPRRQGGHALKIHVERQDKDRLTMPHYAMLVPAKPIEIPGKATHLGLWVNAHSDWGRVVYLLRDANGHEWVSVGTQDEWNNDDTHAWSQFCFDGWRYLDFELPSNAAWDGYREAGRVWWGGAEVDDDTQVALPLKLERIAIERRDHVVYVTDLLPANPADVELGDLYAEYATPADRQPEAARVNGIRVPLPPGAVPANPIAKLEAEGVGVPGAIDRVEPPLQEYDGRRCLVYFKPVTGAASYDIWVSRHADGTGALRLAAGLTGPGELLQGLKANTDLYLFLIWTGKDGKASKPSPAFKINLKDMFPMK